MTWLRTTCLVVACPLAVRALRFCRIDVGRVQ